LIKTASGKLIVPLPKPLSEQICRVFCPWLSFQQLKDPLPRVADIDLRSLS
jgi:hypothetical protein